MPWRRRILLVFTILLIVGSISATSGYALYLRSDGYRTGVADSVGAFLTLPMEIAGVVPRSHRSRRFTGIRLYLPGGDAQIFESASAVWREIQVDGEAVNELDVYDGWLQLGSRRMGEGDYREVLRGGLAHDFTVLKLAAVRFHDIDLRWRQPELQMEARDACGLVTFAPDGTGRAQLETYTLNGTRVDEPITIRATFRSGAELEFQNIRFNVPRMPLASLALEDMTGAAISQGWFEGTVSFQPSEAQVYTLRGSVGEARLEEFTKALPTGVVRGQVDIDLTEARVAPGRVLALAFGGELGDIHIEDVAGPLGAPDLRGRAELSVGRCVYADGALELLSAKANVADVPADAVTRLIGRGRITGTLHVRVNSLLIEDDVLRHADIELDVQPPTDGPGVIERAVVLALAREAFGVDLGRVADYLPERVEYARMGCRLIADGNELRVKGTHGKNSETVLTLRVFGRDLAVLDAPARTFPVADLLERIREEIDDYDVRALLRRLHRDDRGAPEGP